MKIRKINIKNYRSLRDIEIDDINDIIILIGKNGSGKSNILEALELFFTDLDLVTDAQKAFPQDTWFDKRTEVPIEFKITIELDANDIIITDDVLNILGEYDQVPDLSLFIHRNIEVNIWKTVYIELGKVISFSEGKAKIISKGTEGSDATTIEVVLHELKNEIQNQLLNNINNILKNKFKLIRGPRESPERKPPTNRHTIIDPESMSILNTLAVSPDRQNEIKWSTLENKFTSYSGNEIRSRANALIFRNGNLSLPIESSGSGDQAILILLRHLMDQQNFFGIEEPETRLHHDYQRKLFSDLKNLSKENQIFLSTHSCVFVDKAMLGDTWYVNISDKETSLKKLEDKDLKLLLLDLGVNPSDFFMSNSVLFVEGFVEKTMLPLICEKINLDINNVSIIPIHGKSKGKYHLSVWADAAQNTNLPLYFILDKNAEEDIKKLESEGLIDRDKYLLLEKGDFEDYYSRDVLKVILKEYETEEETITFKKNESVVEKINSILKRTNWKIEIGLKVIERSDAESLLQDMDEIIRFLRRIQK